MREGYVEEGGLDDVVDEGLVDQVELEVEFALFEEVAGGDDEHVAADGVEEAHLEGGGADGLDGGVLGEVDLFLAVVADVGVDDLRLHGVEVVEVRAQRQQLVDVQLQGVLLVDPRKGSVAVRTHHQEQVVRQLVHLHHRYYTIPIHHNHLVAPPPPSLPITTASCPHPHPLPSSFPFSPLATKSYWPEG